MGTLYKAALGVFLLFIIGTQQNLLADEHYDFVYPDRESLFAAGWDFMAKTASGLQRNTEQTTGVVVSYDQTVHPGVLRIPADIGDVWANINNTRNTLFHNLPSDWTSITLNLIICANPTSSTSRAFALSR
jgi:hypothetical protein